MGRILRHRRLWFLGLLIGSLGVCPGCGTRNKEVAGPSAPDRSVATAPSQGPAKAQDTAKPQGAAKAQLQAARPTAPGGYPAKPAQSPGTAQVAPWEPGLAASAEDSTVVTVFYGTDRNFLQSSDARKVSYLGWYYATAFAAGITIALALVALCFSRSRAVRIVTGGGLAVTVVLGVATTLARLHAQSINPGDHPGYGNERGDVQTGSCQISVPRYHEAGQLERPSILKLQFREDPRKHVVLLGVTPEPADEFFAELAARVEAAPSRDAFVFVHGFNVTFEDAARKTAQLAYDLKFAGPPIFFSWPSQGELLDYTVDETNAAWAVPHLEDFLTTVARRSGAGSVHLIAHSMGNRALTSALARLAAKTRDGPRMFHEVILTAPDIDADIFKRDLAPAIAKTAGRVTLYASSNDEALALSKRLHGYPRAGESGDQVVVVPEIETVDVSQVDTGLVGHSYYGNNDKVLADMFYLLHQSRPASQRQWLQARPWGDWRYWVMLRGANPVREASLAEPAIR